MILSRPTAVRLVEDIRAKSSPLPLVPTMRSGTWGPEMHRRSFFAAAAALFAAKPILSVAPKESFFGKPRLKECDFFEIPNNVQKRIIYSSLGRSVFLNGILVEHDPAETLDYALVSFNVREVACEK